MKRLACALLALAVGCAANAPALSERERGWLARPEEIPGDFLWRQRVRFTRGSREQELDLAIQKRCGELTLALLVPLAPAPIVLQQRGRELAVSGPAAARGGAPAQRLLLDLHRAFFLELEAPPDDGARTTLAGGQRIVDQWRAGRLQSRSVSVDSPAETVSVEYPEGWDPSQTPRRAVLENSRFRYRCEIETVSSEPLSGECPAQ